MVTIQIDGGKKAKTSCWWYSGALTGQGGIDGKSGGGKINLFAMRAYVAVERSMAKKALG